MTFTRPLAALCAAALLMAAGCGRQDTEASASPAVTSAPPSTEPIDVESFTPQQQTDMRAVVRDYLIRDPSVIREALEVLAARERAEREHAIINDPRSFSIGPADAKVTVVEFFDYTCPFCQVANDWVMSIPRNHPDVRVVFKEYPVRGPEAAEASRAAVASMRQGRYLQFHQALMGRSGPLTSGIIDDLARRSGIDVARMRRDMEDPAVDELLLENHRQAAESGAVTGTPAFMINGEWMNGWPRDNAEAAMNARIVEAKRRANAAAR